MRGTNARVGPPDIAPTGFPSNGEVLYSRNQTTADLPLARGTGTKLDDRPLRWRHEDISHNRDLTSWIRVFTVSVMAFASPFVIAILIELLPLRPPNEGWRANWVYWIRSYLSAATVSYVASLQARILVPAAELKIQHIVFMAFGASTGYILQNILTAYIWRFPVPFNLFLGLPAFQIIRYMCLRLSVEAKRWRTNPEIKKQLDISRKMSSIQSVLVLIYPVYNAIFLRLDGLPQVAFVVVLPIIRYSIKRQFTRLAEEIPIFSSFGPVAVELFDALYLFKCMQSAGSMLSGAMLIIVDLIQNIYHIYNLHKHAPVAIHRRHSRVLIVSPRTAVAGASISNRVVPNEASTKQLDKNIREFVQECEHIVLAEFIECAVPIFYALYMIILFHLPNARYYPEMHRLNAKTFSTTVRNIAIYATLEFLSLIYMHCLLIRKFNISALHLLANVLERDKAILQNVFMSWVIIILQFTLEHNGSCFTLLGCRVVSNT